MSETTQTNPQTPPSKEEVMSFFQEQIDVKKLQLELQELNTGLAVARAEELKALTMIAQLTQLPDNFETESHIVTEEDMELNPELEQAGVKVGDEVKIPAQPKRKLKKETAS